MPRPAARRPAPIVLPNCPMDTLWEVDESADHADHAEPPRPSTSRRPEPLRSVFEDDDDDMRNVAFPLPPASLPVKRFFSLPRMSLPIHSPPKPRLTPRAPKYNTPPRPPRAAARPIIPFPRVPSPAQRPVSPTSSASSSDTEPPRTPPAASSPLPSKPKAAPKPAYVLSPPPPAEWESAIDALFEFYDDDEPAPVRPTKRPVARSSTPTPTSRSSTPTSRSRSIPTPRSPPREPESYISFSPVEESGFPLSPSSDEFVMSPTSSDFCSAIGFSSLCQWESNRPLTSPGLTPTPVSPPARPRRMHERAGIPVQFIVS